MAKDRSDKKEKKEKKEKRRSEDGVTKKHKKDKKKAEIDVTDKLLEHLESSEDVPDVEMEVDQEPDVEKRPVGSLVPFANPLADEKVTKKVLKSVKKAAVNKSLKRGVKEVVKAVRKSPMAAANVAVASPIGIVVIAADISPMDVISHIPVLCEDHGIPYVYVTSRAELGSAGATKRPTSVVMVLPRSGGKKNKAESAEDTEKQKEFSNVYEELTKIVQKESGKVKV